jgi:hypothetical protein
MGLPADASGAYRPNPQAPTKLAPRPSSLKGYISPSFWLVLSTNTASTSQHSDTDLVILFDINQGLFGEVVGVESALFSYRSLPCS